MKVILGLFLCFVLTGFIKAQGNPCQLDLDDMPAVRGLRVGMSKTEFAKVLPMYGDKFFGVIRQPELGKISGFENIDKILFSFLNESSLRLLVITFDKNFIKWKDAKDFAKNLPENIKLPAQCWIYSGIDKSTARFGEPSVFIEVNSDRNTILFANLPPSDIEIQ